MLYFVNAKINIGLQIVRKRPDGYHDLQTVFYPVGNYAGTAENPETFCDMLEVISGESDGTVWCEDSENGFRVLLRGREIDCPIEKNLVYKAARLFYRESGEDGSKVNIILEKHLPDGAGMGGGSADAAFLLRGLADLYDMRDKDRLLDMALQIGADCPFFINNKPMYAEGVGEKLEEIDLDLSGKWLVVVKPKISVSTREAFAGITPREPEEDLRQILRLPVNEWKGKVRNDFEESIFPKYPELSELKEKLYGYGAEYASMTGSGSVIYGIYETEEAGREVKEEIRKSSTIEGVWLLKL